MGGKQIVFIFVLLQHTQGQQYKLCNNFTESIQSCSTQVLAKPFNNESCLVEYVTPIDCEDFGPVTLSSSIGKVTIKPHVLPMKFTEYTFEYIIPTVIFRDIKWKRMKFRIRKIGSDGKYCRSITISDNVKIKEDSVLYYDCYRSLTDGSLNVPAHILDFEATDGVVVERGQYYFFIPSVDSLNPTITELDWKPFIYVESYNSTMKLRILPPPPQLKITEYRIDIIKECDEGSTRDENVESTTLISNDEVLSFEYDAGKSGWYYFVVTPVHDKCDVEKGTCRSAKSPIIYLVKSLLYVFIAVGVAVTVALIFVYVMCLRYCKKPPPKIPPPTKVLVIYSSSNDLHAKCVASFVDYLRTECGIDVLYDGDVTKTTHWDPYFWAEEAIRNASHIVYIVGTENSGESFHNPHNTEKLLLSFLKAVRALETKDVVNVRFEYSNGSIPNETRNDRVFKLLKDWQRLIAHLSKNLLPKTQITRTTRGKQFYEDLARSQRLLSDRNFGV